MHLGPQKRLLITTALAAVFSASGLMAQSTGGAHVTSSIPIFGAAQGSTPPFGVVVTPAPQFTPPSSQVVTAPPVLPTTPTPAGPAVVNVPVITTVPMTAHVTSSTPMPISTPPTPVVVNPDPTIVIEPVVDPDPDIDPDIPTDIPGAGPLPVFDGIGLSALSPPQNVTLTQAVEITAGPVGEEQYIQYTGQTLFGAVMDPVSFDIVEVTVMPSGRMTTVDVSPTTGQFATRVFQDDFGTDGMVEVMLTAANSTDPDIETESVSYTMQRALPQDGFVQALSRITYGATPALYARVRAFGFAAYVEEQLDPDNINDTFFEQLAVDRLIDTSNRNTGSALNEITEYGLAHAAFSAKQLQVIMGNFWANHFHASEKGSAMQRQYAQDREYFRENAFGRFEDLLTYSARSPLMSRFLDNTDNRRGNLNENYGREILELHTVGVDGGYGDLDVIEVSRIFTGWTYNWVNQAQRDTQPREYVFNFREDRHDNEEKYVPFIDLTVPARTGAAGVNDGIELIGALSRDPRTQAYVCGKIVQKFVSDMPPQGFIDNCVAAWEASDGSTEAMLRAILLDPAFINTPTLQRNKAKTPFELAASYVRAFDFLPQVSREDAFYRDLRESVTKAGENAPFFPVPTGLPEVGVAWLNTSTMIEQYKELQGIADSADFFGSDLQALVLESGLETAEEIAAFMLAIATADRFREEEYAAVIAELKGSDGFFEPAIEDETRAMRRAIAIISVSPSFHLQ